MNYVAALELLALLLEVVTWEQNYLWSMGSQYHMYDSKVSNNKRSWKSIVILRAYQLLECHHSDIF